jgi:hypothetical protein
MFFRICGFLSLLLTEMIAPAQTLVEGEGRDTVAAACSQCHELSLVTAMGRTKVQWEYVVSMMISMGAPIPEEEVAVIVNYLGKHYAPAE